MIHQRKRALLERAVGIFERGGKAAAAVEIAEDTVRDLHTAIGDLAIANDLFTKAQALDREVRRGMIERTHPTLSVGAKCQLLSISRSSFHYAPQSETALNLNLMLKVEKP